MGKILIVSVDCFILLVTRSRLGIIFWKKWLHVICFEIVKFHIDLLLNYCFSFFSFLEKLFNKYCLTRYRAIMGGLALLTTDSAPRAAAISETELHNTPNKPNYSTGSSGSF